MIILKGLSITKTSTLDKTAPTGQDLFSHPYTYQWQGNGDSVDGRRVSRDNLFSEPADPGTSSGSGVPTQRPRSPFDTK